MSVFIEVVDQAPRLGLIFCGVPRPRGKAAWERPSDFFSPIKSSSLHRMNHNVVEKPTSESARVERYPPSRFSGDSRRLAVNDPGGGAGEALGRTLQLACPATLRSSR